jgi:DNA-directed RNA polymerase subunit RPC12/RpoP
MNLQEQIRKVLKEETTLQKNLIGLFKNQGVEVATAAVGGFDNFAKILNLNLDDIDTQEMLVKNFINYTKVDDVEVSFIEVRTSSSGNRIIKIYLETDDPTLSLESWYVNTVCDYMNNKLFPFRVKPTWTPVFVSGGAKIFLDAEIVKEEDDQEEITEKWSEKYKKSINCSNPKGFSQKAHCAGKHKKNEINESSETTDDVVGKEFWFEYHCFESPKSCDAELWYRTHNKVLVLSIVEPGCGDTKLERLLEGCPRVYSVVFEDGFEYDVFEDELMESKENFERPDAPKRNQQELDEYARTLKNARQQGVGLRFPKSAIKSNPSRFRPYNRKGVNESDLETKQNDKKIVCEKCGWSWDLSDGGDDPYTCHKCGNENHKEMSLQESIRRILREEFNQLPKYLYHLTSDENYKNILMEGVLNPKYSKQSKRKKGIYLSDDISVAENYRFFYEPNEKVVLLKIKTSSLNEDSFYPDDYELQEFLDDGGWGVDEDIEYSRWYDVPWQLSLKWVNQIQYLEPIPISEIKKI